jgi:isoleucyl-tRNA synthetase
VRSVKPESPPSVHHCLYPTADAARLNPRLTDDMRLIQRLVSLGHAARNKANRKLRQPLAEAALAVGSAREREVVGRHLQVIADELNVKKVRLLDAAGEVVDYRLNPLPKQLGQKYGNRFPAIRQAIQGLPPDQAAARLLEGTPVTVTVEGQLLEILPDEVEVRLEAHPGFAAAGDGPYVAALVTELTDALVDEGLAREVVRRVQDLRKQAGLEVDDRIVVDYDASPRLAGAMLAHMAYLCDETLADRYLPTSMPQGTKSEAYSFEGESLVLGIRAA